MNIVHFAVATNGVLTKKDSVSLAAVPVAMTVSPDGNTLYVVSGTTTATLSAFTLSSGALGTSAASQASLIIPGVRDRFRCADQRYRSRERKRSLRYRL